LLQAIAKIIAEKNEKIENLHEEIHALKTKLHDAEKNILRIARKGKE
jgi:uncharacterized coiled-coil protein SlyX